MTLGLCIQALKEERGSKVPWWWWQEIKLKNPQNIATNKYIPKNSLHLGTLIYMMTSLRDALEIHSSVHVSVTNAVSLWQAIHSPHLAAHYPTWQWTGGHRVCEISCADCALLCTENLLTPTHTPPGSNLTNRWMGTWAETASILKITSPQMVSRQRERAALRVATRLSQRETARRMLWMCINPKMCVCELDWLAKGEKSCQLRQEHWQGHGCGNL